MTDQLTLALDQGTHATRGLVFDRFGQPVANATAPVRQRRPAVNRFEQDPVEIMQSIDAVLDSVLEQVGHRPIGRAGFCVQRSSVLAWDSRGLAVSPVLGWQDTRAASEIAALQAHAKRVRALTGLRLSAHYGAAKLRWLRSSGLPSDAGSPIHLGPLGAFLVRHLVGVELVDEATAGRTLLWDVDRRRWDPWLLDLFGIDVGALPKVLPVCADFGVLLRNRDVALTAVNGDQGAALYALGTPDAGALSVNLGTGGFLLLPLPDDARPPGWEASGLLRTLTYSDAGRRSFALEGTVNGAGAALEWLRDTAGIAKPQDLIDTSLAQVTDPPPFINTIGGLGSPWWRPGPPSGFPDGLPAAATAVAAVVESIVFLVQRNIDVMRSLGTVPRRIRLGGGLANSDGLCQRLADLSGLPVERYPAEASSRGIAWLAAGRPTQWQQHGFGKHFEPRPDSALEARYQIVLELLRRDGAPEG